MNERVRQAVCAINDAKEAFKTSGLYASTEDVRALAISFIIEENRTGNKHYEDLYIPCPECGKALLPSKFNSGEVYCSGYSDDPKCRFKARSFDVLKIPDEEIKEVQSKVTDLSRTNLKEEK